MAKKLKSRLFRDAASLKKEFHEHLSVVWDMSPAKQAKLLKHLPKILQTTVSSERAFFEQDAVKSIGGDATKALQAIKVLRFFAQEWNPFRDSLDDVFKDIKELSLIPKDRTKRDAAEEFLRKYLKFLEEDSGRRMKTSFAASMLPNLRNVTSVIDYRVVVESRFDWQKDNPDKYQVSCSTMVPVIIVRISRDEGDPLIFQCEPDELEMLVRSLKSTLKEYKKSKDLLK